MPDKDENKPLVQLGKAEQRRNGAPSSGAPTVYNVKDPAAAQAGSAVMQAGLGMVQNDLKYSAMENMFLDDWRRMMRIKNHNN